ncbi:AsmA family protein [Pelagibius sp.]|uniref:AsmA family protein n=1 Tax=Pelagibius sp. TaxID=1931238 RepID=UPI003B50B1F6
MRLRRVIYVTAAVVVGLGVATYAFLSTLNFDDLTALLQREVKAATGRDLVVAGPVDLQISLTPSIDLQDLRFANASWGSRAEMVTLRRLELEVDLLALLGGDIVVNRLVLVEPDIVIETDAEGTGNWEFGSASAPSGSDAPADSGGRDLPDIQDFAILGGRLTVVDGAGGQEPLTITLTEATGRVPDAQGERSLTLVGRYNDSPFRVSGTFDSLRDILSGARSGLDLAFEAGGASGRITGSAGDLVGTAAAEVAVSATGEDLSTLSPFVGAALPALGPYALSGDIAVSGDSIAFSGLAAELGQSDVAGAGSLDLGGERPRLTADLAAKTLDLADFRPGARQGTGSSGTASAPTPAEAGDSRVFSDSPLGLEELAALDGRVTLSAAEARLTPRFFLNDLNLTAQFESGRLTVEPLRARLAEGALSGRALVDAGQSPAAFDLALDGAAMDFGELLRKVEVDEEVGGALDAELALRGRGDSLHAMVSGLDGHLQAVSQDGTIDNALLSFFSVGLGDITGPLFGSAERARLECMIARFDIAGGKAESRALVLDTGTFAVAGRGGIDLGGERVSMAFDTETSQPSLASLAVPFKVIGPLADPSVVPDPIGAAGNVVGTVGTVAETGGNIVAGVVDTLGGLVGTGPIIGRIGGDQTLCGEALEAIGLAAASPEDQGVAPAGGPAPGQATGGAQEPSSSKGLVEGVGEATEDLGRSLRKGLQGLFGD